jgi:lysophospholipase L1-like esterase
MRRSIATMLVAVGLVLAGCAAAEPDAPDPSPDGPIVAFYGDSYTRGTGASSVEHRWSTRISAERGWREVNPSVNGLGFVNNRQATGVDLPTEIIAADPDIVMITMGLNDVFSYERVGEGIRRQIEADFAQLTEALPDARFIVVEPFWYTTERPEGLEVIIGWVHDAAENIGADYIPGASTWIQGRPGEMASDGLHPNDDGYAAITERMDAALVRLGL